MKAEELQVGDWVIDTYHNKSYQVAAVDAVANDCLLIMNGYAAAVKLDNIEPIPLTEEILLKNGWTTDKHETGLYRGKPYFGVVTITAYMGKTWDLFDGNVTIQYVHELQHAINLCGLIKDIVV